MDDNNNNSSGGKKKTLRMVLIVAILVIVTLSIVFNSQLTDLMASFLEKVEELGFIGAVLFAIVYCIATVAFIPGSFLTLGAGFVFTSTNDGDQVTGTIVATLVVFVGASCGATFAALASRYVFRDSVSQWVEKYKTFKAINKVIETNGLKIVFLLRLSPVIPFNALNYLLGTTNVKMRDYIIAHAGLLPGTVAFCFIGSTLSSLSDASGGGETTEEDESAKTVKLVFLIVGSIITLAAVFGVSYFAKKELNKQLALAEGDQKQNVTP